MKIFVTGATGFVGSHLVRRLLAEGFSGGPAEVICLARNPGRMDPAFSGRVVAVEGSLESPGVYEDALRECEYVFHLAGEARLSGERKYRADNVDGTRCLLDAASRAPSLKRFLFTSTVGAVDRSPSDPCAAPLLETTSPNPLSEYGRSKLECERMVSGSGLPFTIVRPTWVYGPGMRSDSHIRVFMGMMRKKGLPSRVDFPGLVSVVHVRDLVDAMLFLAGDGRADGETYFVSDGEPVSIGSLFRKISEIIGERGGSWRLPSPVVAAARRFRARLPLRLQNLCSNVLWADPEKLLRLGFKPAIRLDEGLLETARWDALESGGADAGGISLVTGSAGGIGRALSRSLYARGHDLLLLDRKEEPLRRLAAQLSARHLCLDLSREEDLEALRRYVDDNTLTLRWVINNAGVGARGHVSELGYARQREVLDVNCGALLFLSQLALDHFRRTGAGVLVNIASSAAFQPLPSMSVYAASKAFVLSYTAGLWAETKGMPGVIVLAACPAGTATGFQAAAGVKTGDGKELLSPEDVSARILKAVSKNRCAALIGGSAIVMWTMSRFLGPRASALVWAKLMARYR